MTKVNFGKKCVLRLLLAGSMLFISFPIVNASGASATSLAQFSDSAWSQGEPLEVSAPVAQRIEHQTTDQKVRGSNPCGRTIVRIIATTSYSVLLTLLTFALILL